MFSITAFINNELNFENCRRERILTYSDLFLLIIWSNFTVYRKNEREVGTSLKRSRLQRHEACYFLNNLLSSRQIKLNKFRFYKN